jgi:hypothetical protein
MSVLVAYSRALDVPIPQSTLDIFPGEGNILIWGILFLAYIPMTLEQT